MCELGVLDLENVYEGMNCLAMPFVSGDSLMGCVAISGPSSSNRFTKEKMEEAFTKYVDVMKEVGLECNLVN